MVIKMGTKTTLLAGNDSISSIAAELAQTLDESEDDELQVASLDNGGDHHVRLRAGMATDSNISFLET